MRSFLAGIFLLLSVGTAWGQATGYVTALGFQNNYRPDCWTPLLIHLDSTAGTPEEYQVRVHQQDLDRDIVVYARTVTLGPQAHQNYWVYFIPQPVGPAGDGGSLPSRPGELAEVLRVELYDKAGRKPIARLPVAFSAANLDPARNFGPYGQSRGTKLVLAVLEAGKPSVLEYDKALGLAEDIVFIPVTPQDLPDSVLGFEAIDAVLWLDADAGPIAAFGGKPLEALQQYVARGGQLVVCQPPTPDRYGRVAPFADMLPVVARDDKGEWAIEAKSRPDLAPLMALARARGTSPLDVDNAGWDNWAAVLGGRKTWDTAKARARPDAVVDQWIEWDAGNPADVSPYLARRAYGTGAVAWVAQDLSSSALVLGPRPPRAGGRGPAVTEAVPSRGWAHVWDHVFGWNNATYTRFELEDLDAKAKQNPGAAVSRAKEQYAAGTPLDFGASLLKRMEHGGRGAALIFLAIFFFIGYWVVAGPGSYLFLAARRKKGLSWLVFGLSALVATVVTVGVVRLVLRGKPEAHHVSVVRLVPAAAGEDGSPRFAADVRSRIGLYIPRDGDQRVSVADTTAGRVSTLAPFAVHPQFVPDNKEGFLDQAKYVVDTDQFAAGKPVAVDVPYRSTLKKLQAEWAGTVPEGVYGSVRLVAPKEVLDANGRRTNRVSGPLVGQLVNKTGRDLAHVYFAYSTRAPDERGILPGPNQESVLYVPAWPKDTSLDLDAENQRARVLNTVTSPPAVPSQAKYPPQGAGNVTGLLNPGSWPTFWYPEVSITMTDAKFDDSDGGFARSVPLMALYDRVAPNGGVPPDFKRVDVLRHGGRGLNVSPLVAAGRLVVLAQSPDGPLPLPLDVDGERVTGEGVTFYEIALPLDRTGLATPATRPATAPAAPGPK